MASWHFYRARWRGADYPASPEPHALELWVRLRSGEPLDGFEEVEPGCHVRTVPVTECDWLHVVTVVCRWRGEWFQVHGERDGLLLLEYLGGSVLTARELGLERVERGVWRAWAPRPEVTELREDVVPITAENHHF
ncbi:hypothetical protein HD597_003825 [Nonomuraea thailandensis]|uniref:Uncharacterized protein n=1 Tax=Nonomuraea thailandensis TaxID=1188745 RepID=A0A9X2GFE1_9ACTN|nr:hypothetical protein [Nonomuraea thailandensis]MCP2356805.1 hypothetical protein [Nonomuraea thailandensis]